MQHYRPTMKLALLLACACLAGRNATAMPATQEGDYFAHDFTFRSGEKMAQLRLHYTTLGKPLRDGSGRVTNAVLILHGTGGTGAQFLVDRFAGVLFNPGQLLDANKYFIVLPDSIGHGLSSKPSDGLHARFPQYDYDDMVAAQHELLLRGLKIDHLRLIIGTSMGCMHSFVWGETFPDFVDAIMPLACLPVQIAGRNRMWRDMILSGIRQDPEWNNGEYRSEPRGALRLGASVLFIAGSAPIQLQNSYPTRDAADQALTQYLDRALSSLDANDLLYQVNASRNYDPAPRLNQITARLLQVNSADDFINPPELGIAERMMKQVKHGRFVLLPASGQTHGHGTHTWAAVWQDYLRQLLAERF
jgi:homoserine O-acetyltransferase/O-succinyltransferase